MSYSIDPITADCYPETAILINKFDVMDETTLAAIEAVTVMAKAAEWEQDARCHTLGFDHYKAIHKFLFFDLYEWAGQVRKINLSKKGTQFCPAAQIENDAKLIFDRLMQMDGFSGLGRDAFVEEVVDFYIASNHLHPFREGNGRTQRVFLTQLIRRAGYDIDFSEIDGDTLMIATIQAAGGVTDQLRRLFREAIRIQ